ncbi:HAD family hydrolase [Bosea sp. RAF48]|uniref:HAD family hydrolase n=1 Tax=Bosea sp. RAF48 TaxID=3237480 RepID=UPI003F8E2102
MTRSTGPFPLATRRDALVTALIASVAMATGTSPVTAQTDPLPSWNDGNAKQAIKTFVEKVTRQGGPDFVPVAERIATFDNDGTLWSEQPLYFQGMFLLDRIKALAPGRPEWQTQEPFKSLLAGDLKAVTASGTRGIEELVLATHAGMDSAEFERIVKEWMATARHPKFNRPYNQLVYKPMVELLAYLRANGFKTYIVSGGGVEFMRPWVEAAYGIPPEQVVGSGIKLKYELVGDKPELQRLAEVDFIDDGPGKPVGIAKFIGQRPVFAAGNSDGDLQMLQWTTLNTGQRFALIVHHTDAEREFAYDRQSQVGWLDKALDEAPSRGWLVVDMRNDWKTIYGP